MIPMDEAQTRVAVDLSNLPYLVWKVDIRQPKLGSMDTELFKEWFHAFAQAGGITLHVENLYGVDDLEDFVQEANLLGQRMGREDVLT